MAVVTELVTKFGFEGSTAPLASYNKALGQAVKGLAGFAAATSAALAVGAGVLGIINKETAQMSALADAVGLTTRQYQAYGMLANQVGLDSEVVADMLEEMNNKFGESTALMAKGEAPLGAVSDAMGILGLEFENISKLKPDEQFRAISKAIEAMPDAQQAASAADILFGGDANKFFANMKKSGQSLEAHKKKMDEINFLTEKGEEGSIEYTRALSVFGMVTSSVGREISGILGGQLTPEIKNLTDGIVDLIKENKDWVVDVASRTVEIAVAIGKAIGRLTPFILAGAAAWGVMALSTIGFSVAMKAVFSPLNIAIAAIAFAALIIDDLIVAFQGGNSVIAEFAEKFLGIDIVPMLHAMVDGVKWAVKQIIDGFKMWFDFFEAGWAKYSGIVSSIAGFFSKKGEAEIKITGPGETGGANIQNDMTRSSGGILGTANPGSRVNNNKIENTTSITIQATSAEEARVGVDNALQDQLRNTETALNRID